MVFWFRFRSKTGWKKGSARIVTQDDHSIKIESTGKAPYIVSPDYQIEHQLASTLPVKAVLPFVVGFFVFVGLLLFNRLQTESLTIEQLRDLQRL